MASEGGGAGFSTSFSDITGAFGDIFGTAQDQRGASSGTTTTESSQVEKLSLDEAAVQKIIQDVLGGAGGLADIFSAEQASGVFNSSVAAQATGDLASRLVGELAKLTGEKQVTQTGTQTTKSAQEQQAEDGGLLEQFGIDLGGIF